MKALAVVRRGYYDGRGATEPMLLNFTLPLEELGFEVETFDHFRASREHGRERSTEALVERIRRGGYDLVMYQTFGSSEPIETAALQPLAAGTCIVAWNSDDDWQWEATSRRAPHFTYMVTTYPSVWEANRGAVPNLLLSQWGCHPRFFDFEAPKPLGFTFVGSIYGRRNSDCRRLRRWAGLRCFGRGARLVGMGLPYVKGSFRVPLVSGRALPLEEVYRIWNASRVSFTPMSAGNGRVLSLKGRAFEMGMSGTLMLCEHAPDLERYFEPGRECVTFSSLEECAQLARWYLAHEAERRRIALAYRDRTAAEHTWAQRYRALLSAVGLGHAVSGPQAHRA